MELLRERFEVDVGLNGDLAEKIGAYDAIVIRSGTKLTAEVLERADRLKVIGRAGVGVDNVDVEALAEELDASLGDRLANEDPETRVAHTRAASSYASSARVAAPRSIGTPRSPSVTSVAASAVVTSKTS